MRHTRIEEYGPALRREADREGWPQGSALQDRWAEEHIVITVLAVLSTHVLSDMIYETFETYLSPLLDNW